MEKEKKIAPKKTAKKSVAPKTIVKSSAKTIKAPAKVEEVKAPVAEAKVEKVNKFKMTLNQEFNLLIGLFSIITIISFCFAFQGGEAEMAGWDIFLKSGSYSGVFRALLIAYVATIIIDCILAIPVASENEILNIVEKALYMFTIAINAITIAVLLTLISNVGIGLIIFFVISIISAIVKLARIYS